MELSDKEKELFDFIKSKCRVTVKEIQESLGDKAVGGIGKLIKDGKIEKKKVRENTDYNTKAVVNYQLVETKDDTQES